MKIVRGGGPCRHPLCGSLQEETPSSLNVILPHSERGLRDVPGIRKTQTRPGPHVSVPIRDWTGLDVLANSSIARLLVVCVTVHKSPGGLTELRPWMKRKTFTKQMPTSIYVAETTAYHLINGLRAVPVGW